MDSDSALSGTEMGGNGDVGKKITVGVCVMEKKVKSGPEVLFVLLHHFSLCIHIHYT